MQRRTIRLTVCALLSLLFVFGSVAVLRHGTKQLPLNPIAAAQNETLSALSGTQAPTTQPQREDAADPAPEHAGQSAAQSPQNNAAPRAAAAETTTAPAAGTDSAGVFRPDGVPGQSVGIRAGSVVRPAGRTAPAAESSAPANTPAPVKTADPDTASPVVARPPQTTEPTSEPTTEPEAREPVIVTDLSDCLLRQSELTEETLRFYAYLDGDTAHYTLRVRLTREADSGTGTLLQPDGIDYSAVLPLGVHQITLTLLKDGAAVSFRTFTIEVVADKASAEQPTVGDRPPVIETNLDGWTEKIENRRFSFVVRARTAAGAPIAADGIAVTLDGAEIRNPTGGSTAEYPLFFEAPNVGEEQTHTVTVLAWDHDGNSAFKTYTVIYRHVPDGDRTGSVTVILDATTVGLGLLEEPVTLDLHQGENAAQLLLRVLNEFGYQCDYSGSDSDGFYLRRIGRAGLCDDAKVPDRLWTLILRDGLVTTGQQDRDSLGEHDYTQGAGWMYAVNNTLYPGKGMERTYLNPGDTLRVCFTLSFGKDVGGYDGAGSSAGSLAGYCGVWRDGLYTPLEHTWVDPDGDGHATCAVCHEERKEGADG